MEENKQITDDTPKDPEEVLSEISDEKDATPAALSDDEEIVAEASQNEDTEKAEKSDKSAMNGETEAKTNLNKKKKGKKGLKILIISVILMVFLIIFGAAFVAFDYLGIGFSKSSEKCELIIKPGETTAQIAKDLEDIGAIKSQYLFRIYVKLKDYDGKFREGRHYFSKKAGYEAISHELMNNGADAQGKTVTIVEGKNIDEIAALLEKEGICTKKDFQDAVQNDVFDYDFVNLIPVDQVHYRLEGYLFPDTYQFYCNGDSRECAHLAVDKMLSNLNEKLKKADIDINNITVNGEKYTFHEIMTLASMVEMEASSHNSEMPNVAAIFFNRLRNSEFITLGSSPTRDYPYEKEKYNTDPRDYDKFGYVKGIPAGPMCSPGIDSIKATCSPTKDFDYLYFVTDAKMKFYYNKTLSKHNETISQLQAENNWIYE